MSNNNLVPIVLYECDIPISHFLQSIHHLLLSLFWRAPKCQSTENNLVWRISVSITCERRLFLRQSLFPSSEVSAVLETIPVFITGKWSLYWRLSLCPVSINDHSLIWQRWSLKSYTPFQTLLTKCPTLSNCEPHFSLSYSNQNQWHIPMYTDTFFVSKSLKYNNDGQIMLQITWRM